MRFLRFALIVFSGLIGALLVAWSAGALYFDLPASPLLRTTGSILWAAGAAALGIFGGLRRRILAIFERHALAGGLPFAELKAQALINGRAQEAGDAPDFSQRIRAGLAGF